ncbi:MAG: hypothetical protein M0Q13_00975 [Methanothrix sp.]|jgi:hypothetical protein|nr:hypothetical protein [Methanothrix sp.]
MQASLHKRAQTAATEKIREVRWDDYSITRFKPREIAKTLLSPAKGQKIFNTFACKFLASGFPGKAIKDSGGRNITHEENKMDPFNIGLYVIEAGLVGIVVYAMAVLPALFMPMI